MKEDLNKPLYADYRKGMVFGFDWSVPVTSGGKYYWLADMPLVVIGRILIVLAIGVVGWLNPYSYRSFETAIVCLILIIIATSFYKYKFTYRFGRFSVLWEDRELHPETLASSRCDKDGKFLKNEENRKAAKKSRCAFLGLFAAIIAVVLLYCFLWIGLSYLRIPSWHRGEIEEVWQIAQKYDYVIADRWGSVGGKTENGEDISKEDRRRIWEICRSLRWEYVYDIYISKNYGYIDIGIGTIFGYSKLEWHNDNTDISCVKDSFGADIVTQLDEHWFYVRQDDAEYWW